MSGDWGTRWLLGLALLVGPAAHAQSPPIPEPAEEQPEYLRGYVIRVFQSDGTPPAESKGRVLPAVHLLPIERGNGLPLPRMPHGYQDPTHPVGPSTAKPQ